MSSAVASEAKRIKQYWNDFANQWKFAKFINYFPKFRTQT